MPEEVTLSQDGGVPDDSDLSLAEHAAQFGPGTQQAPPEPTNGVGDEGEPAPPTNGTGAEAERDSQGRFQRSRPRHVASPDDLPTIAELTRRIKEAEAAVETQPKPGESTRVFELRRRAEIAEARRDALKATTTPLPTAPPAAPVPRAVTPHAPAPSPSSEGHSLWDIAAARVGPEPSPEPFINDEAVNDYTVGMANYFKALRRWERLVTEEQHRIDAEQKYWEQRKADARTEYPDFDAVAIHTDVLFEQGSTIDLWILKHRLGAKVLYHLQRSPDEVRAILALPELEQHEALALLAQRLSPSQTVSSSNPSPPGAVSSSSSRAQAGTTGSAAAPQTPVAPRPPNPVRTGPMKTADEPPGDDDMSLANHERYFGLGRRR